MALDPLGRMTNCKEVKPGSTRKIHKIEASHSSSNGLTGLKYYAGSAELEYGDLSNDTTVWTFTEENPLIGVYGTYSSNKIQKLGFISLNTRCQMGLDDGGNTGGGGDETDDDGQTGGGE